VRYEGMEGGLPGVHLHPQHPAGAWDDGSRNTSIAFQELWTEVLGAYMGRELPFRVFAPCCGQFMVSRERILAQPADLYERLLEWLDVAELPPYLSGRAMEYSWHILFGEPCTMQAYHEDELYFPETAADS